MLNTIFILSFISGMPNKLTTEQFIEKARKAHGDKYDYSLTKYILNIYKVKIICPQHGEFEQNANSHLTGNGCNKCSRKVMTKEQFVKKAIEVHGDKYDYSLVEYLEMRNKIKVICPQHGEFEQRAFAHLKGQGCRECWRKRNTTTKEEFIERAKKVHGDKYDYSMLEYVNVRTIVKIICPQHGEFEQQASSHLAGNGCNDCAGHSNWYNRAKRSKSFDSFKAYFVKFYDNDDETFYKIGTTYNKLKKRLRQIPYKYEIINVKEIKDINDKEGVDMLFRLESRFKKMYKNKKYTPKKEFHGMGECFSDKTN